MYVLSSIYGQIVYHNYDPDIFIEVGDINNFNTEHLYCDINNDSINDIGFTLNFWVSQGPSILHDAFSCSVNQISGQCQFAYINTMCSIEVFISGDTIWNNLLWDNWIWSYVMYADPANAMVCNPFSQFRYMAFSFNNNGNIHYGWLKLRTSYLFDNAPYGSYAMLYISEFAFNSDPNCGLIAGDTIKSLTTVSVDNIYSEEKVKIYPNPVTDILVIKNADKYLNLTLTDIFGKIVYKNDNLTKVEKIACDNFNRGLYFITFKNSNEVFTQKVIIGN